MKTRWQTIADRLAQSLRAMPCRCQHGSWAKTLEGSVDRPLVKRCSRCLAIELYDAAIEVEA